MTAVVPPSARVWREVAAEHPVVTAVLVAREGHLPWLRATLEAIHDQHRRPDRLVVVDGTPDQRLRATLAHEFPEVGELDDLDVTVVKAPHEEAFASLVDRAVQALPQRGDEPVVALRDRRRARPRPTAPADRRQWLWLLHEDSAPTPGSLAAQLRAVGRSERVGIAGCKITELDRPGRLVNIGIDVTRSGRHVARTTDGELDQGQHDGRHDVLAVSSAGMLVRQDVYLDLGGFDPAFDGDGDGLDLCWRAHLAGHGVIVVPAAGAHQDLDAAHLVRVMEGRGARMTRRQRRAMTRRAGDPDRPAARSGATVRRHRQVALARTSSWRFPFALVWATVSSALLGVLLLLLKRPRAAASEFGQATAGVGLARILAARRRFRGRAVVSAGHFASLFVPASVGRAAAWDAVVEALTPGGEDRTVRALAETAAGESGPTGEESEDMATRRGVVARAVRHPGSWAVVLLAVMGGFVMREPLSAGALHSGRGIAGGELNPYFTSPATLWHAWRDAWQGPGFGHEAASAPYLPFLAIGAWLVGLVPGMDTPSAAASAITWLFLAAPALAGWSAYLAGRAATTLVWPRAVAALCWGSSATLTTALATGRLGPVVTHIALPLALAGLGTVARARAGVTSTAATALVITLVAAFTPASLPVFALGLIGILVAARRSAARWRALAVLVTVPLLLGHWSVEAAGDLTKFVGGPGTLTSQASGAPLSAMLLQPGGPGSTLLLLGVPVLFFGLWGAAVGRGHDAARWGLVALALLGLGVALVVPRHGLGAPSGLHLWAGLPLQLTAAALMALGLLGADGMHVRRRLSGATRRTASVRVARMMTTAAALTALVVVALTGWKGAWSGSGTVRAVADPMPAVVAHETTTPRSAMMLDLRPRGTAMTYTVRSREAGLPATDPAVPAMTTPPSVARAVAALVDPAAAGRQGAARILRDAGIAFVTATRGGADTDATFAALDSADGLTPMASSGTTSLYRIDGAGEERAARVVATGGDRRVIVPVAGAHARADTRIAGEGSERTLVIAAGRGFARAADVRLDGERLAPVASASMPTYRLPAAGGHLVIDPGTAWPVWRVAQLMLLGLVAFLAVPIGSTRMRERA